MLGALPFLAGKARKLAVLEKAPPPGMRVSETSQLSDIEHWHRMYSNRFFNPSDPIVTETDVKNSLEYYQKKTFKPHKVSKTDKKYLIHRGNKYFNYLNSQELQHLRVSKYAENLCPITVDNRLSDSPDPKQSACNKFSDMYRARPHLEPEKDLDPPKSLLLRRPRVPGELFDIFHYDLLTPQQDRNSSADSSVTTTAMMLSSPLQDASSTSIPLVYDDSDDSALQLRTYQDFNAYMDSLIEYFDSFRDNSLTTFFDEAPFTENSYYVKNYPLLMQTVPRQIVRYQNIREPNEKLVSFHSVGRLSDHHGSSTSQAISDYTRGRMSISPKLYR